MFKLLIFMVLPILSFCQQKHDDVIIIKDISLKSAINALMDNGYTISKYDTAMGYVTTDPKSIKNSFTVILNIRVKDPSVIISGQVKDNVTMQPFSSVKIESTYSKIEFRGMKGSVLRDAFEAMRTVALSFKLPVTYAKLAGTD